MTTEPSQPQKREVSKSFSFFCFGSSLDLRGPCRSAAKTGSQEIKLRGFGAARRRLDMPHHSEIALEHREQRRLGAALQHLAEERSARGQDFAREISRGLRKCHDPQMIGLA